MASRNRVPVGRMFDPTVPAALNQTTKEGRDDEYPGSTGA